MLHKMTFALGLLAASSFAQATIDLSQVPLFVSESVPPLNMLVMGRDHKLYYEAYNDASDLNGDGVIDVGYKGHLSKGEGGIDYYGYFNSHVCYDYSGGKFTPASATATKKCSGKWSGDFLNYLTTSRMDALRKVLYGGYRETDTTAETVLQAVFIPQDAHTWGKEYLSPSHDGYNISDYTNLPQPVAGYRHLFAVASLTDGGIPQLRTLTNTPFRVWNWVSQERPVAGSQCTNSSGNKVNCTSAQVGDWNIVPAEMLSGLTLTTWKDSKNTATNTAEMDQRFSRDSQIKDECGSGPFSPPIDTPSNFNNPYTGPSHNNCTQDNYHTLVEGKLTVPNTGNYQFSVDGDDAVDFLLWIGATRYIASRYGDQGASNTGGAGTTLTVYLEAGKTYAIQVRHEENSGDASFRLYWKPPVTGATEMVDRNIRVAVCPDNDKLREDNCVAYGDGKYKPTGILHDYGATDRMYFGLLSGSYQKNISGGTLRSPLQSFSKEFDAATGRFCSSAPNACSADDAVRNGIVDTINKFRVIDFKYSDHTYGCGWIATAPMTQEDTCYMWGNPIGEMMYETMRYFAGASGPTPEYDYSSGKDDQSPLNLPKVDKWINPYSTAPQCAAPVMTVISDINPSYDYKLPGSNWGNTVSGASDPSSISSLNVSSEADKIWAKEGSPTGSVFIGESNGNSDGAPTAKSISNFSTIRGLSPEEPTKQGTYYSAAIAHFGANNMIGGDKELLTYTVALASPLPTFDFPVKGSTVTIVPFAKSVGGRSIDRTADFQPTNQIVDFYVETIANTDSACPASGQDCDGEVNDGRPYAKFRINFEDVEQGADHDMDAIALYEIMVNDEGKLVINMTSEYAAGDIDQHMGYVISGTTKDGIYLEVKDQGGKDVAYKLDTPDGKWAGECGTGNCAALSRLSSSRTFSVSGSASANFLENPLWYAAKYGVPGREPDTVEDDPDNYFLVTNALTLKDQLAKAFNDITQRNTSVTNPSVDTLRNNTASEDDTAYIYRTTFDVDGWSGDLIKEERVTSVDPTSGQRTTEMVQKWSAEGALPSSRTVLMASNSNELIDFSWSNRTIAKHDLEQALDGDGYGPARVNYLKGQSCSGQAGCNTFRTRTKMLGDIVNSSPVLVKDSQYLAYRADTLDGTTGQYRTFQEKVADRSPMVYVGANDGMLHAFNADSGEEVFAFIPTPVIQHLPKLTSETYGEGEHQFYVDGTPVVADVYYDDDWHTVLVGSLGAGGRGVFALDITNPSTPKLLWEFTNADDGDMGYSIPQPTISRLHNGKWAALIPNGYNSDSANEGKAALFVVDIKSGDVIRKLETQTGEVDGSFSNGLSSVRTADFNGDGVVDYAYAGDLRGNLWRFDLLDTSSATPFAKTVIGADRFGVSFGGAPLFVAVTDDNSTRQPITAPPVLVRHPTSTGYLVIAGTGRYLGITDKASTGLQTVYSIWDRQTNGQAAGSTMNLSRAALQEQTITENTVTIDGETRAVRLLSDETFSWYGSGAADTSDLSVNTWGWFVDLKAHTAKGERVIDDMRIYGDGLVFSTVTPNADPCSAGLDGFVYAINPSTGGRTAYNVFDLSGDGRVNTDDSLEGEVVSGLEAPAGGWNISGGELYFTDGSPITVDAGNLSSGRQSWRLIPGTDD